jgi:MOSC domain-containing protein YiiM
MATVDFAATARNAPIHIVPLVKVCSKIHQGLKVVSMNKSLTSNTGRVKAVSISPKKGVKKTNISQGTLLENCGFEYDAHAGNWHRQVSLLAIESIDKIRQQGLNVGPGDFAENITTEGLALWNIPVGTRLQIGRQVLLEVTQIGKECHNRCAIYDQVGDCVMPKEGIFAKVITGGAIKPEDPIQVLANSQIRPPPA